MTSTSYVSVFIKYTKDKLDHIHLNKIQIQKRELMHALGTAISWITGNMYTDDKAKYKIIKQIVNNEYSLENNVENQ